MVVAFTGHRPDKLGGYATYNMTKQRVIAVLGERLTQLKKEHPGLKAISGMAQGVDQWAAQTCLGLRIPYTAAVPFLGQELRWPEDSRGVYRFLIDQAESVVVVCPGDYKSWKMQKRNEWMVDHCNLLLAIWDGSDGGTANCVRYAQSKDIPVERLTW